MPHKALVIVVILFLFVGGQVLPQTITRWHRIPGEGQPQLIRHPLERADQPGQLFQLRYENLPQARMQSRLKHGFNELLVKPVQKVDEIDISRATQQLENLDNEANMALEQGYEQTDIITGYSIFDPDRPQQQTASESLQPAELPVIPTATISLSLSED